MKSGKSRLHREKGEGRGEKWGKVKAEGVQYGRLSGRVWSLQPWKSGSEKLCASVEFFWDVAVYRWLASHS